MNKFIGILLSCIFICGGSFGANLYNLEDGNIKNNLELINRNYHINTDIHVLNPGDPCADRLDFSACVREKYDDGVDLIFVINNDIRKMETSINESIATIIPRGETLHFEQAAVPGMQEDNIKKAIEGYLETLTSFIENECVFYQTTECTSEALTTTKILYEEQQSEDRARQTVKYLWTVVILLVAVILILGLRSRWKTRQRDATNRSLLNQLIDHSTFLGLTVKHDTHLTKKDKKILEKEIANFQEQLETLSTSSPERLHLKLREEKYESGLEELTSRYQEMLELLGNSKEILAQVQKIKSINL